jgi:tRNA dimethylallyltransferase
MKGIGYREMLAYLDNRCTIEDAVEAIKKNSRNYAKRQLTWFRREQNVEWVNIAEFNYKKETITEWITEKCLKLLA